MQSIYIEEVSSVHFLGFGLSLPPARCSVSLSIKKKCTVYLGQVGVDSPTGTQEAFKHGSDGPENEEILVLQQGEKLTVRTRFYSEKLEILFYGMCVSAPGVLAPLFIAAELAASGWAPSGPLPHPTALSVHLLPLQQVKGQVGAVIFPPHHHYHMLVFSIFLQE